MTIITKLEIQTFIETNNIKFFATQQKLCLPIINRIYKKMLAGISFSSIKVDNNLICDGHHRYIASLLAGFELDVLASKSTSATILIKWENVIFENEDWDTQAKINMLNQQDADYNNLSIEKIAELLK